MSELSIVNSQPLSSGGLSIVKSDPLPETKPGWDTFKSNMFQTGTIGEYLDAARHALGVPTVQGLLHAPAALFDWAKGGFKTEPSGGFLTENPIAEGAGNALAAVAPPDLASVKSAAGNAGAAAKAGVGAAAKSLAQPSTWTGAGVAGMAAHEMGLDPGAAAALVGGSRVMGSAIKAARNTLAARAATVPGVASEDAALLEGLAQGQGAKSFAALAPEEQAHVRDLAGRIKNPAPVETPAPKAAAAPVPPPVISDIPSSGKTIADIAREELSKPQSVPAPPSVSAPPAQPSSIAQQLFEEMQSNGEIPAEAKPGEPIGGTVPVDPEPFVAKARAVRGTDAQKIAKAFKDFDIPSSDLGNVTPPQWNAVAKSLGVDFPASKVAQAKLIRETGARLREMESSVR